MNSMLIMCTCTSFPSHTHDLADTRMFAPKRIYTLMHTLKCTHARMHARTHALTHIHTHTHTNKNATQNSE